MVYSPPLPLVDGLIPLILFSVSKFEGKEKDHVLFRGEMSPYCDMVQVHGVGFTYTTQWFG